MSQQIAQMHMAPMSPMTPMSRFAVWHVSRPTARSARLLRHRVRRVGAVSALERSIPAYYEWLRSHDEYTPIVVWPLSRELKETQEVAGPYPYQADAFFGARHDPVSNEDLDWLLALLEWSLDDLLHLGERIPGTARSAHARRPAAQRLAAPGRGVPGTLPRHAQRQPDPTAAITLPDAPPLEQLREVKEISLRRLRNVSG